MEHPFKMPAARYDEMGNLPGFHDGHGFGSQHVPRHDDGMGRHIPGNGSSEEGGFGRPGIRYLFKDATQVPVGEDSHEIAVFSAPW